MIRLIIAGLFALSSPAIADCWVVSDMKGYSTRSAESYAVTADGFTGRAFQVEVDQEFGAVRPSNMRCRATSPHSLLCAELDGDRSTMETWSVDPVNGRAFHTKAISGFGPFDGANLFVGKITGRCEKLR